ncbi:hypothetical protein CACET_c15640 [Clostridium aceticum]|uniref:Uncharacterized protein n=1 Tax=Clostridium aceticum TaxID=84022 RepID=A0A0D8ICB4_9CLOT|nr:hypothetical protein [Clostridium aceticum]AKL95013.1 hypothetical protein CACET_c15640 [Clostridium aceticum]KJF27913.1 hypothetical protein TZ02_04875 [Clostridium aceticum]
MIVTFLQDCLIKELQDILGGMLFKNSRDERVPINIYSQYLPAKEDEDDEQHYPYIIARVLDGDDSEENQPASCKIMLIIGLYDEDDRYQGYKDVMNVIEKIRQFLLKKRMVAGQFILEYPLQWAVNEEDVYPFYFGGIETNWTLPGIRMEDEEGMI